MGKLEKKHGKGRLDHYYKLAKERGYRARSSFKIIQLNQKYGFFKAPQKRNPKPMCIIDLCAAPGSWCQVAAQCCPPKSLIIGVDLDPIRPLPNVITFQSDITSDHCRSQLRGYLKTWKADVVMHDGAPNVGMAWAQDAFSQSQLVLQSLKLAVEFLMPGGWFISKVFRSKDYNKLMWIFQQFFDRCEATKPPASRNVSAEIFVVCRGFKAPNVIDQRLLDTKYVFEELREDKSGNYQAKISEPEKKQRHREGYEENNFTFFKTMSAIDFVKSEDPVQILGTYSALTWDDDDPNVAKLKLVPQTTIELLECIKDLKVLGRGEFRSILRWRIAARKFLELDKASQHQEQPEPEVQLTLDEQIDKELEDAQAAERRRLKRERRHRNEERQRAIYRMQMKMTTPDDIAIENNEREKHLFDLGKLKRRAELASLTNGTNITIDADSLPLNEIEASKGNDTAFNENDIMESEDEEDELEILAAKFDSMYETYVKARGKSARNKALMKRQPLVDAANGFIVASEPLENEESDSDPDSKLSSRAAHFFDQKAFKDMLLSNVSDEGDSESEVEDKDDIASSDNSEAVQPTNDVEEDIFDPTQIPNETDEAIKMALAQQLALGQVTRHDLSNEAYNKISFRDTEGLPAWFLDDEKAHTRILKPITRAAVAAAREQLKALNARPIKKVAEAQMRKRRREQRRLAAIRKKTDLINNDESLTDQEKTLKVQRMISRSASKAKKKTSLTLVVARGVNRGVAGRPSGVRGRYKMVDPRMKKEMRAQRRLVKLKR